MNYRVSFFKIEKEQAEKGKFNKTGEQYLGSVVVDDSGTSKDFTLTAKAFRIADDVCSSLADKVVVEKLR